MGRIEFWYILEWTYMGVKIQHDITSSMYIVDIDIDGMLLN